MSAGVTVHAGLDRQYTSYQRILDCGPDSYIEFHLDGEQAQSSFFMHDPANARAIAAVLLKGADELEATLKAAGTVPAPAPAPVASEEVPF